MYIVTVIECSHEVLYYQAGRGIKVCHHLTRSTLSQYLKIVLDKPPRRSDITTPKFMALVMMSFGKKLKSEPKP